MAYLLERDTLNGKEGSAFIITEDKKNEELFNVKSIKVDFSVEESDMKVVGTRIVQKKTTGVSYTGSMTIYYGTDKFKAMLREYVTTGRMPYFDLQITNDDPATSVGIQTCVLRNCKINSGSLAMLDADADFLTEDVSFTFTKFEILKQFHRPPILG